MCLYRRIDHSPSKSYDSLDAFLAQVFPVVSPAESVAVSRRGDGGDKLILIEGIELQNNGMSDDSTVPPPSTTVQSPSRRQFLLASNERMIAYAVKVQSSSRPNEYVVLCVSTDYPAGISVRRGKQEGLDAVFMTIRIGAAITLLVPLSNVAFESGRRSGERLAKLIRYQQQQQQQQQDSTIVLFAFVSSRYAERRAFLDEQQQNSSSLLLATNRGFPNDRFLDKFAVVIAAAGNRRRRHEAIAADSADAAAIDADAVNPVDALGSSAKFTKSAATTTAVAAATVVTQTTAAAVDFDREVIRVALGSNDVKISPYHHDNRIKINCSSKGRAFLGGA